VLWSGACVPFFRFRSQFPARPLAHRSFIARRRVLPARLVFGRTVECLGIAGSGSIRRVHFPPASVADASIIKRGHCQYFSSSSFAHRTEPATTALARNKLHDQLATVLRAPGGRASRPIHAASAGDEITAADLAVYPIYAGRKALPDNAGLNHLQAWGERIGSRPGVQKAMKLET
jgi:hypothetical protein